MNCLLHSLFDLLSSSESGMGDVTGKLCVDPKTPGKLWQRRDV